MKTNKRNDDVSWSRRKGEQEKFDIRNEDNMKALNKFIDDNEISLIVASSPLFYWLEFFSDDPEMSVDGEIFRYRGIKVIYDCYFSSKSFGFVKKEDNIKFDVPCVCGIYSDEKHP